MKQLQADLNNANELILVESKTMRDQHVYRDDVLLKVSAIPELLGTTEVTTEMAAEYYNVSVSAIKMAIKRNKDEFNDYEEIRLLKGKSLKDFKSESQDVTLFKGASSVTLISRRGLLRLGMLLTESEIAKSIRSYLLNVEEVSDKEQKRWAVEREISIRERNRLTEALRDFYHGTLKAQHRYPTFTNLVYKVIFDMNKKQLVQAYELDSNDNLRSFMTTEDLRKVVKVEQVVSSLILLGKDYQEIKSSLFDNRENFQ